MRYWLMTFLAVATFSVFLWASDRITWEGERTIYTAECRDGAWQGPHCTGKLVAGDRYRFRVLQPHREVVFWTVGSATPSGKFTDCDVQDGRNWTCRPNADVGRTITLQMTEGVPVAEPAGRTRPFHPLPKWRWTLLHWGLPAGGSAEG
jgi:hypothetical protein